MFKVSFALVCGLLVSCLWLCGCGAEGGCIAEGTLISTPGGGRSVETLKAGDFVLSVNPKTGQTYPARIIKIRSLKRSCFPLTTVSGNTLWLTAEHPVYDPSASIYREAREWQEGGATQIVIVESEGHTIQRAAASKHVTKRVRVFDITVDSPHRNFVANGILVHNKSFPPPLPDIPGIYKGWVIATQLSDTVFSIMTDSLPIHVTFFSDNLGRSGQYAISPDNAVLDSTPPEVCFWDGGKWFFDGNGISLIPLDTVIIFDTVLCVQTFIPISLIGFDTVFFHARRIGDTLTLSQPLPIQNMMFQFRLIFQPISI